MGSDHASCSVDSEIDSMSSWDSSHPPAVAAGNMQALPGLSSESRSINNWARLHQNLSNYDAYLLYKHTITIQYIKRFVNREESARCSNIQGEGSDRRVRHADHTVTSVLYTASYSTHSRLYRREHRLQLDTAAMQPITVHNFNWTSYTSHNHK